MDAPHVNCAPLVVNQSLSYHKQANFELVKEANYFCHLIVRHPVAFGWHVLCNTILLYIQQYPISAQGLKFLQPCFLYELYLVYTLLFSLLAESRKVKRILIALVAVNCWSLCHIHLPNQNVFLPEKNQISHRENDFVLC